MADLITDPHFSHDGRPALRAHEAGDAFYAALVGIHDGLDDADSQRLNARLILLLANHIGDTTVLRAAMAAAREDVAP